MNMVLLKEGKVAFILDTAFCMNDQQSTVHGLCTTTTESIFHYFCHSGFGDFTLKDETDISQKTGTCLGQLLILPCR